jgi:NitT/TauT family transport system substrate-binding protein
MKIKLAENFRAIFYAPFYALKVLNLATDEGLEIEWIAPDSPGSAIDDVRSGAVDLTWGGPMRVMKDHDTLPADGSSLVCFGEVVTRDPFYLVGAGSRESFTLNQLPDRRLGVVFEVPTPWLCLQADLQDLGIEPSAMIAAQSVKIGLTLPEQVQALKDGDLDVAQLLEPYVSQALAENAGQLLFAQNVRGPTVYTTFICSRDGLVRQADAFRALTRALQRALDWVAANGPAELARLTAAFFPDVPPAYLLASIERYCRDGIWSRDTTISKSGFERLAHSLHAGGFIASPGDYASCVHRFDTN